MLFTQSCLYPLLKLSDFLVSPPCPLLKMSAFQPHVCLGLSVQELHEIEAQCLKHFPSTLTDHLLINLAYQVVSGSSSQVPTRLDPNMLTCPTGEDGSSVTTKLYGLYTHHTCGHTGRLWNVSLLKLLLELPALTVHDSFYEVVEFCLHNR